MLIYNPRSKMYTQLNSEFHALMNERTNECMHALLNEDLRLA